MVHTKVHKSASPSSTESEEKSALPHHLQVQPATTTTIAAAPQENGQPTSGANGHRHQDASPPAANGHLHQQHHGASPSAAAAAPAVPPPQPISSSAARKRGPQEELARQVNRFSAEELRYLEKKFAEQPTPNVAAREEIALHLSKGRMGSEEYQCLKGNWCTKLSQVQIKYWFDHQRRKRKRLRQAQEAKQLAFVHAQAQAQAAGWATTMGVTPQSVGAYGFGASQGMVGSFHHPGVSMSPVPQYDPSALVGGQYHAAAALQQIKTPAQAACDAAGLASGLQRTSPTGVLPSPALPTPPTPTDQGPPPAAAFAAANMGVLTGFGPFQGAASHPAVSTVPPAPSMHAPMASMPMPMASMPGGAATSMPPVASETNLYSQYAKIVQQSIKTRAAVLPLGQNFVVETFKPNEEVLGRGEALTKTYCVLSGVLKISHYATPGASDESPSFETFVSTNSVIRQQSPLHQEDMKIETQTQCCLAVIKEGDSQELLTSIMKKEDLGGS